MVTGRTLGMLRRSLGEEGTKDVSVIKISDRIHTGVNGDMTIGDNDRSAEHGRKEGDGVEWRRAGVEKAGGSRSSVQRFAWETRGVAGVAGNEGTLRNVVDSPTGRREEGEGTSYVALPPKKRRVESGAAFNETRALDLPDASTGQLVHLGVKEGYKCGGGPNLPDKMRMEPNPRGSRRPKKRVHFKRPIIMRREEEPSAISKIGNPILRIGDRDPVGSGRLKTYPLFYQRAKRHNLAGGGGALRKDIDTALALHEGDEGVFSEGNDSWNASIGFDAGSPEFSCSESTYFSSEREDNQVQQVDELGEAGFLLEEQQLARTGEQGEFIIPLDCAPPESPPKDRILTLEPASHSLGSSPECNEEQGILSRVPSRQTISIAGREVEWVKVREVLRASKLKLVGVGEGGQQGGHGLSKSVRRKGKDRELKNLEFNVQYTRNAEGVAKVIE